LYQKFIGKDYMPQNITQRSQSLEDHKGGSEKSYLDKFCDLCEIKSRR